MFVVVIQLPGHPADVIVRFSLSFALKLLLVSFKRTSLPPCMMLMSPSLFWRNCLSRLTVLRPGVRFLFLFKYAMLQFQITRLVMTCAVTFNLSLSVAVTIISLSLCAYIQCSTSCIVSLGKWTKQERKVYSIGYAACCNNANFPLIGIIKAHLIFVQKAKIAS